MTQHAPAHSARPSSATVALWAAAALLGFNLMLGVSGLRGTSPAMADPPQNDPPFNAAEQRKRMIDQLTQINDRLARLEGKLDKGINVKVTEMPAIKVESPKN